MNDKVVSSEERIKLFGERRSVVVSLQLEKVHGVVVADATKLY